MGGGVEVGMSLCGLGRAARLVLTFLLQCPPGVAPGASHERLADVERGLGHAPAVTSAQQNNMMKGEPLFYFAPFLERVGHAQQAKDFTYCEPIKILGTLIGPNPISKSR